MWLHKAVTTVFGLGFAPFAPGTFGALGAILFYYILLMSGIDLSLPILIFLIVSITLLGVYSTKKVIPEWGDDPSKVVVDEFVGILVTMILIPVTHTNLWLGFILFRFFDILKPLGIRWVDKNLKDAWGVMLDDVLAGVYACISLHALNYFFNF
ncbi:MAG: phosphatidylglycerophosphatase A [Saprospiraceae bacterium]|nr:phosphatidylglycerophosphatase A [Bacteroidia bacterium]NNE14286.1 phosphatidylglycerophosphatase A [Saprospiraceae bacterium]NNL92959.1 phosphatidylglycerophosphatase A [Saprospiraceae bacterium]